MTFDRMKEGYISPAPHITPQLTLYLDLPDTHTIRLEENYRSTGSILASSLAIIEQGIFLNHSLCLLPSACLAIFVDPHRPDKSLFTSRIPNGPKPVLKHFSNTAEESEFMASEIKRILGASGGIFGYGDCAILGKSFRVLLAC
jgi:DNA helicase-2/ATP-dependent DNA helicase PcrA